MVALLTAELCKKADCIGSPAFQVADNQTLKRQGQHNPLLTTFYFIANESKCNQRISKSTFDEPNNGRNEINTMHFS